MTVLNKEHINKIYCGDALELAKTLPDCSVQCMVTSPPYWNQRDYGCDGQLGQEATPTEYVSNLVTLFRELRRVLRDDGVVWINLGDVYINKKCGNLKPKDLAGMPWRVAFALQDDGWWLRNDALWEKSNCLPQSMKDRLTCSHEYIFLLSKKARYFYDRNAIREKGSDNSHGSTRGANPGAKQLQLRGRGELTASTLGQSVEQLCISGRNRRTIWTIATTSYPKAHFSVFPEEIPRICILAGTSARGQCPKCGSPHKRIIEKDNPKHKDGQTNSLYAEGTMANRMSKLRQAARASGEEYVNRSVTVGWQPTCEHNPDPIPCVVLDPFMGSGTTAAVAKKLGRSYIGFELNPDYIELAEQRIALAVKQQDLI